VIKCPSIKAKISFSSENHPLVREKSLFFEVAARRRQIRGIHQRHGVRLASATGHQSSAQMLIDPARSAHPDGAAELVQHARGGTVPARAGKALPRWPTSRLSEWVEVSKASRWVRQSWATLKA